MTSTSRKLKSPNARPKKYAKATLRQVNSVIMHYQRQETKSWDRLVKVCKLPKGTIRGIIAKHLAGAPSQQQIAASLRAGVLEAVRSLMRLRKTKRFSRLIVSFEEINDYVRKHHVRLGFVEVKHIPKRTVFCEHIAAIEKKERNRGGRKIRTVFNVAASAEAAQRTYNFANRGYTFFF